MTGTSRVCPRFEPCQLVFKLPRESQRIQFRAEAFNVFNNVNFTNPSLALTAPSTFGEYQGVMDPRVMQFALRYEF